MKEQLDILSKKKEQLDTITSNFSHDFGIDALYTAISIALRS